MATSENISDDPGQVVRRMNNALERKDHMVAFLDSEYDFETFLTPAPTSIAILGHLMAIASKKDFSLEKKTPMEGFKHVKHPSSFRATLVQISNSGCDAFILAHKNMDKIRLYSMKFQENVKHFVEILLKGSKTEQSKVLPRMLQDMKEDAEKCSKCANETEKGFDEVVKLIDETAEASAAVKGVYEQGYEETKATMKKLEQEEKELEQMKREMEEEKKQVMDEIAKAKNAFDKSLDMVPGVKTMLAVAAVEETLRIAIGALNLSGECKLAAATKGLSILKPLWSGNKDQDTDNKKDDGKLTSCERDELQAAYQHVAEINKCVELLYNMFIEDEEADIKTKLDVAMHKKHISDIKKSLGDFKDTYKKSKYNKHPAVEESKALCKTGITICDEMLKLSPKKSADETFTKIKSWRDEVKRIQIKVRKFQPHSSISLETPKSIPDSRSKFEILSENARLEVELRKKELAQARKKQENVQAKDSKMHEEQLKVLEGLSKTKIDQINFEEIQEILRQGIISLSQLKKQWSTIVVFFSKISNGIDICISQRTITMGNTMKDIEYSAEGITRKVVLEIAASVNAAAYTIEYIAKVYTDISTKHLVQNTAALSGLLAYDPSTEYGRNELERKRDQLNEDCTLAKKEIEKIVNKCRADMNERIDAMYQRLEKECERLPISPERMEVIEEISDYA